VPVPVYDGAAHALLDDVQLPVDVHERVPYASILLCTLDLSPAMAHSRSG